MVRPELQAINFDAQIHVYLQINHTFMDEFFKWISTGHCKQMHVSAAMLNFGTDKTISNNRGVPTVTLTLVTLVCIYRVQYAFYNNKQLVLIELIAAICNKTLPNSRSSAQKHWRPTHITNRIDILEYVQNWPIVENFSLTTFNQSEPRTQKSGTNDRVKEIRR